MESISEFEEQQTVQSSRQGDFFSDLANISDFGIQNNQLQDQQEINSNVNQQQQQKKKKRSKSKKPTNRKKNQVLAYHLQSQEGGISFSIIEGKIKANFNLSIAELDVVFKYGLFNFVSSQNFKLGNIPLTKKLIQMHDQNIVITIEFFKEYLNNQHKNINKRNEELICFIDELNYTFNPTALTKQFINYESLIGECKKIFKMFQKDKNLLNQVVEIESEDSNSEMIQQKKIPEDYFENKIDIVKDSCQSTLEKVSEIIQLCQNSYQISGQLEQSQEGAKLEQSKEGVNFLNEIYSQLDNKIGAINLEQVQYLLNFGDNEKIETQNDYIVSAKGITDSLVSLFLNFKNLQTEANLSQLVQGNLGYHIQGVLSQNCPKNVRREETVQRYLNNSMLLYQKVKNEICLTYEEMESLKTEDLHSKFNSVFNKVEMQNIILSFFLYKYDEQFQIRKKCEDNIKNVLNYKGSIPEIAIELFKMFKTYGHQLSYMNTYKKVYVADQKGTDQQAFAYASKFQSRVQEQNQIYQKDQNLIQTAVDDYKFNYSGETGYEKLKQEFKKKAKTQKQFELTTQEMKNLQKINKQYGEFNQYEKNEKAQQNANIQYEELFFFLAEWQQSLLEIIQKYLCKPNNNMPSNRASYIILDPLGASGKSNFAGLLAKTNKYIVYRTALSQQKELNLFGIQADVKIIFYDLPRQVQEEEVAEVLSQLIELTSNRIVTSNKYKGAQITFDQIPLCIGFCNKMNYAKLLDSLSVDRINVWKIGDIIFNYQPIFPKNTLYKQSDADLQNLFSGQIKFSFEKINRIVDYNFKQNQKKDQKEQEIQEKIKLQKQNCIQMKVFIEVVKSFENQNMTRDFKFELEINNFAKQNKILIFSELNFIFPILKFQYGHISKALFWFLNRLNKTQTIDQKSMNVIRLNVLEELYKQLTNINVIFSENNNEIELFGNIVKKTMKKLSNQ